MDLIKHWQFIRKNIIIDTEKIPQWIDEKHYEFLRYQKDLSTKPDSGYLSNKKEIEHLKNWFSQRIEFLDKMCFPEKV